MKTIHFLCRILLGLTFAVLGLNGFLGFLKLPPPEGAAGQFMSVLRQSGYLVPVFGLQLIAGMLLLCNRLVPLALALLAPIVVNIALYHVLLEPHGLVRAVVVCALWAIVFQRERSAFAGVLPILKRGGAAAFLPPSGSRRR